MIIRELKPAQFEHLHNRLKQKAHTEPLDAGYTVDMTVSGVEYAVKLQPESRNRMAVLQALRIERDEEGVNFQLITEGNLLLAFIEILIYQGLR